MMEARVESSPSASLEFAAGVKPALRIAFAAAVLAIVSAVAAAPVSAAGEPGATPINRSADGPSSPSVDNLDDELARLFESKSKTLSRQRRQEIVDLVAELTTEHPENRQRAREQLVGYGTDPTPFLLELARSPSHNDMRAGLVALAMIKDPASAPYLEEALEGRGKHFVTMFAALGLGKIGLPTSAEALLAVVLDTSAREAFDRAAAAVALARIGDVASNGNEGPNKPVFDTSRLRSLLKSEGDTKVVASILMALGKARDIGAFELIQSRAESTSDRVRRASVLALGDLRDERAIGTLLERVKHDEDEKTVQFAAGALSAFVRDDVRALLLSTLDRDELGRETKAVVLRALGAQTPSPEIEKVLIRFARGGNESGTKVDPLLRSAALASLRAYDSDDVRKTLSSLLTRDDSPKVRSSAIVLLAQKGVATSPFRKQLRRYLGTSEDRDIAETAALALALIEGDKARAALEQVPDDHIAKLFIGRVLEGLDRRDATTYLSGWIDLWAESLGGTADALLRNLANEQLIGIFELDRRLTKGNKPGGDSRPRLAKALSTSQQDLKLWLLSAPYFDAPR